MPSVDSTGKNESLGDPPLPTVLKKNDSMTGVSPLPTDSTLVAGTKFNERSHKRIETMPKIQAVEKNTVTKSRSPMNADQKAIAVKTITTTIIEIIKI